MFRFIKKACDIVYNKKYKVKGTSSVELIFFLLTCSILCFISYKIYHKFKKNFENYEKIIDKKSAALDKQLDDLLKNLDS